jgi:phosphate uptake regulator
MTSIVLQSGLDKNFRFLVLEVRKQIEYTFQLLRSSEPSAGVHIQARDNYVDHLKSVIENKCFALLRRHGDLDKGTVDRLRAMNIIAGNLEHIADHAVSIALQTTHFANPRFFQRYDFTEFFEQIAEAFQLILDAYEHRDVSQALAICRSEVEIDRLYKIKFERILTEMQGGDEIPDLVTSLFIFHYLERIGDSLLNIGEAILFYKLGEKLKLNQYQYLRETLAAVRRNGSSAEAEIDFEGIWETRSGCRIGKVTAPPDEFHEEQEVIYKEGPVEKIRLEKEGIDKWNALAPGLPPRIVDYQPGDEDGSILLEFFEGENLQRIILTPEIAYLQEALDGVKKVLSATWQKTKEERPTPASFLSQLIARLDDVYDVHPHFRNKRQQIGGLVVQNLDELLRRAVHLDDVLLAPFSVFGHGDFNLDNVIYNPFTKQVHFIDLHRSRNMDFVQDVSVFLASSFRVPITDRVRRRRLNRVAYSFYEFARSFAREQGDKTFQARLALGLIRSFITSTRFEFDEHLSGEMYERAIFLLNHIVGFESNWEAFKLPDDIIVY